MNLEIEAKLAVPSLEPIVDRLAKIGAEFIKTVEETDTYLKDAKGRLWKNGCGLRLRRQKGPDGETVYLTFKGPKRKARFKTRTESETQVSDYEAALKIFVGLGYKPAIVVEKIRQIWRWNQCLICLDTLPKLGCFVEIEGPDEKEVEQTLKQLHLSDLPIISEGYAKLTADTLRQNRCISEKTDC